MTGTGGFQTQAYNQPVMGIEGDFASQNPYFTYDAGPGGLVAGSAGLAVGRFAWAVNPDDPNGTPTIAQNFGYGPVSGFVHREQQALITAYLGFATQVIPPGFDCTLATGGDFWVVNNGTTFATRGQKAFAYLANGKIAFANAGSVFGGASATGSSIAQSTFSVTGSVLDDILTVTAVGSGTVVNGATISGTGIATGTQILAQLTGTTGGVGTYLLNVGGQASTGSVTVSGTYGTLTIGTATGTFVVGDILSGSSVVANTAITQNLTGSGGSGGTMVVNNNTLVNSTTITASTAIETPWYAMSTGPVAGLVKITDHWSSQLA